MIYSPAYSRVKPVYRLLLASGILLLSAQCKFDEILQPDSVLSNQQIQIIVKITDEIPETTNAHRGVLCLLVPNDWEYISGSYAGTLGSGSMLYSADWGDSAQACYPANQFDVNMKWIGLISDYGYTYPDSPSVTITINMLTGPTEGCFELAYLATKATQNLICSGWSPFTYGHTIGIPEPCEAEQPFQVEPAPDWGALFDRDSGWTGSDAAYSIPLSGYDAPQTWSSAKTLFVFGDTFMGEVDSNDHRVNATMLRNTIGVLRGTTPLAGNIDFITATDDNNQPRTLFLADTPNSNPGDWIWPMDGIATNGKIYVFGLRLMNVNYGWGFEIVGATLISFQLDSTLAIQDYRHVDAPIYYRDETDGSEIVLGQAVMPMTLESGNPNPDGYVYVYGPRNSSGPKQLVAARVLPEQIEDFTQWTYWDGTNWVGDISSCANLTSGISQEFSVTPLADGRCLVVFQMGDQVGVRFGAGPTGPFEFYDLIYDCPEPQQDPDIFVYNAKAHPHLSAPGELLISYNVNSFDFGDLFTQADIYRPRFITLHLDRPNAPAEEFQVNATPPAFKLFRNYPNPFNPATTFEFEITGSGALDLVIYDLLGREIVRLVEGSLAPGRQTALWNGRDGHGQLIPAGIYMARLMAGDQYRSIKMILLK